MPGHKGKRHFGMEKYDLTEMYGADSLFEADGIIAESEKNASELFGADTFYSAVHHAGTGDHRQSAGRNGGVALQLFRKSGIRDLLPDLGKTF